VEQQDTASVEKRTQSLNSKGLTYWTDWITFKGSSVEVAKLHGVTRATVVDHLSEQSKRHGFKTLNDAKRHFGFRSVVSDGAEKVSAAMLKTILEMQGYKCALSGKRLTPEIAVLDHKIPLSRGGTNDASNLQWLDSEVNKAKGTMDCQEFIAMCKLVARQAPTIEGTGKNL
jgi:5-methylcytosine-specific restriction endonuclease McrA